MFTSLFQLEQKPVTVFSSGDAGAPTLTKDPGSLKTLLKACLVTGYGSKASLGWQMLFESADTKSAAFASTDPTASKYVIKINNSTATSAKISAYQSMTNIDTGVKPMAVDNDYELFDGEWRLVGHSKAFILLLNVKKYTSIPMAYPILFGDLPRETKRLSPVVVFWTARTGTYWHNGLQSVFQYTPNGVASTSSIKNYANGNCYPVVTNNTDGGVNIIAALAKFNAQSFAVQTPLYDTYLCSLPDSTWSLLPMLQPISTSLNTVANLGSVNDYSIKACTGNFSDNLYNSDCVVPTDYWWA